MQTCSHNVPTCEWCEQCEKMVKQSIAQARKVSDNPIYGVPLDQDNGYPSWEQREKIALDAMVYGTGVSLDGQHIPVENLTKPSNPKDAVGIKKAPMSTVSAAVMAEVGVAMMEGALKYGRHNYRGVGVRASVYYDATMRHMFSWWEGEDIDPDSGLSHVTKAITSLTVLRDAMIQNMVEDDRPPRSSDFYKELNERAKKLAEKYRGENPHHYTIKDEVSVAR